MKDENIHIGEMIKQFLKFWKIYISIGTICLIAAIIFILLIPREYRYTSSMQLLTDKEGMVSELKMLKSSGLASLLGGAKAGLNIDDEMVIIQSRKVMGEVITENNLQTEVKALNGLKKTRLYKEESPVLFRLPESFLDTLSYPVRISLSADAGKKIKVTIKSKLLKKKIKLTNQSLPLDIETPIGRIHIAGNAHVPLKEKMKLQIKLIPLQVLYEDFLKEITVEPAESMSDIVIFWVDSDHRQHGKDVLNSLMNTYNKYSQDVKVEEVEINSRFIKEKMEVLNTELTQLEYEIELYKRKNELPDLAVYGKIVVESYEELQKALLETQTQLKMLDYLVEYVQYPENEYSAVPLLDGAGEKAIEIYNTLILERLRLLQFSEPENPTLLVVNKQLAEQRKILLETLQALREGVKIALSEQEKKHQSIFSLVERLPTQEREYIELKRQQKVKEAMFLFLMQKLQEKELANAPDELKGRIIDYAYASAKVIYPRKIIVLLVAFFVACILSVIVISIKLHIMEKKRL